MFVQKEQFGVAARRHQLTFDALILQNAGYPALQLPDSNDLLLRIVQLSTIAHQQASGFYAMQLPHRAHPVLQRH